MPLIPELPSVPEVDDVPEVEEVPEEPSVPDVPVVPLTPDVPDVPSNEGAPLNTIVQSVKSNEPTIFNGVTVIEPESESYHVTCPTQ